MGPPLQKINYLNDRSLVSVASPATKRPARVSNLGADPVADRHVVIGQDHSGVHRLTSTTTWVPLPG